MPKTKRVIRRVSHGSVADFDDQLWPINCLLLIMAAMVAGLVLAVKPSFAPPRLDHTFFNNGWVLLGGIVFLVASLLAGTWWLQRRQATRRMQLAVLLALFLHLWVAVTMYVVPLRFAANAPPDGAESLSEEYESLPITLPDYGRPDPEIVPDAITQPLDTPVPDQQELTAPRPVPHDETPIRRQAENEPAATTPTRQPNPPEEMQRAAASASRRNSEPSPSQLSRSESTEASPPSTQSAPTIEAPRPSPVASQQPSLEASSSQQRQQASAAAAQRSASNAAAPQAVVQTESLTRRTADASASPTSAASLARSQQDSALAPSTESAATTSAAPAATASTEAPLEATAASSRLAPASAAQSQRHEAQLEMNRPTAQPSLADAQRAVAPQSTPQLMPAERSTASRSDAPIPTPSVAEAAAAPSADAPAVAQASQQSLQPSDTVLARAQLPSATPALQPDRASDLAQASQASSSPGQNPIQRSEIASGSAPAIANPLASSLARATSTPSRDVSADLAGAATPVPTPAANGNATSASAQLQPGGTSVARLSQQQSTAASRAGGPDSNLPGAAASVGAASTPRAASTRNAADGPAVNIGMTAQLERSPTGIATGGGPMEQAPQLAAASPNNAGGSPGSGSVDASQQSAATGRIVGSAESVAAARGVAPGGAGNPDVQTGAAILSQRGTTQGTPQLTTGQSLAGSMGRTVAMPAAPGVGELASAVAPPSVPAASAGGGSTGVVGPSGSASERLAAPGAVASRAPNQSSGPVAVGQANMIGGTPSVTGRAQASPQLGSANQSTAGLQRQTSGLGSLPESIAAAPAAGAMTGPAPQTSGPSGTAVAALESGLAPAASASRRTAGEATGNVQRGMGTLPVVGDGAAQPSASASMARAASNSLDGPQLAGITQGSLSRALPLPGVPTGDAAAELAEAEGPQPGSPSSATLAPANSGGGPPQRLSGSIAVKAPATEGVGGMSQQRLAEAGLPHRLARPESQILRPSTERFVLERTAAPLSIDAPVKAEPAPAYRDRNPERRDELARSRGGSPQSERAVEMGLDFLARHQSSNGRWSLHGFSEGHGYSGNVGEGQMESDTAGTGLALLAFLGAGYTHLEDKYRDNVAAGLQFLIEHQQPNGDLFSGVGGSKYVWLYSHGIAAIALCEAYGMTRDPALKEPAQKSLDFIMAAQNTAQGGWRYAPGVGADTSVSGWQLMALKSGQMTGLRVNPDVLQGVQSWLDGARDVKDPALFVYRPRAEQEHQRTPSPAMTAEAMLMRLYLGGGDREMLLRGAAYLRARLPSIGAGPQDRDAYYWYYATQVMFHLQGEHWQAWNNRLRPLLTESQEQQGPLAGSWNPRGRAPDRWGPQAGRIYVTAMHLLMLEVYYRHLPLFGDRVVEVAKP